MSNRARALAQPKPAFLLTPFGEAEFINALELRVFRKEWTKREARAVREEFLSHQGANVFQMQDLPRDFWQKTLALSHRHTSRFGIRTLELLHVAAAVVFRPDVFFTFDQRQRKVARAEGLNLMPKQLTLGKR